MDDFRIDTHKLQYHPRRVADWLEDGDVYPLYVEISPCSACNHRCIFCAFDYLGHEPEFLEPAVLKRFLRESAAKGVKSVLFSGEGETLMHKALPDVVEYAKKRGLDVALTTNGVLLSAEIAGRIIPRLTWLRVSLNAGTAKTYGFVHGTKPSDFDAVMHNLAAAVRIKRETGSACTIGVQFLLLRENEREAVSLAKAVRGIGVDYLAVKPYSQHPRSINRLKEGLDYRKLAALERSFAELRTPVFNVIFRKETMGRLVAGRAYKKCYGLPFAAHLTAEGELYGCSAFIGDERFSYGNVHDASFEAVWRGAKRRAVMRRMAHTWDIADCREACRLDAINGYLWELKHPGPHVNFI